MKRSSRLLGVACLLSVTSLLHGEVVTVVSLDGPLPSVVTTDEPLDKHAADDLCDYLSRVSGRKITVSDKPGEQGVIFHVGRDAFVEKHAPEIDKIRSDGYILKCVKSDGRYHIILAGGGKAYSAHWGPGRPAQWAVEQFLMDYCGVRWLFPDPKYGKIVPSRGRITVESSLHKKYEPDYLFRWNVMKYYNNAPNNISHRLRAYLDQYGQHAIQFIFSEEDFKAHPEWFAYFGDTRKSIQYRGKAGVKRRQWWTYGNGWQICTSNPGTVKRAVEFVMERFRKYPDAPMVSVGPNDGGGWCECPECTKFVNSFDPPYTITERWFTWVNQVAREVGKTYPDKWVETLAYGDTSQPPRFDLEPNISITKTIVRASDLKLAEEWHKRCKSVNIYGYPMGLAFLGFRHYPHAMKDFLKWGHEELGAIAAILECHGNWTLDAPKYMYTLALQWDVNADVDVLMDDFCKASYGLAAKPMRAFWDRLEQVYERRGSPDRLAFWQWVGWGTGPRANEEFKAYTPEDVGFMDRRISQAVELAGKDDEGVQFRVERMADVWKFYQTILASYTRYYQMDLDQKVTSEDTKESALKLAREIAKARAERKYYLGKARSYPHINPGMCQTYYFVEHGQSHSFFSHEQTLLDELCGAITRYVTDTAGEQAAVKFWQDVPATDDLHEAARTQVYLRHHPALANVLPNGGFESGRVDQWETSGQVSVISTDAHTGKRCMKMEGGSCTLIQKVPVKPKERYRLTAWIKYLAAVPDGAVPAGTGMTFSRSGSSTGSGVYADFEPTRCLLRNVDPAKGWTRLYSHVTIPPAAEFVTIELKKQHPNCVVLWDDVRFEKIKDGPDVDSGEVVDTFEGQHPDMTKWQQSSASGGYVPPKVSDGWLVHDGSRDEYPLTCLVRFGNLLKYEGKDRCRLRFHVSKFSNDASSASHFSFGLQAKPEQIATRRTGAFYYHYFNSSTRPQAMFTSYSYQGKTKTYSGSWVLKHLKHPVTDVWYTIFFDPKEVTVYASSNGYDDSDASLVCRYVHGITDAGAEGPLYLKIAPYACKLDEISLTSPGQEKVEALKRQE